MPRSRWYDSLLAFLREQPGDTRTLTLTEIETLVGQRLPRTALLRSYWWNRQPGTMGPRLAAAGWRVAHARRGGDLTVTFMRISPDTIA
jgi:hypothetical protein